MVDETGCFYVILEKRMKSVLLFDTDININLYIRHQEPEK